MAPSIAPGPEMRRPTATVRRERGRHLGDAKFVERRFYHHLGGKLHARGAQIQIQNRLAIESAQAAMKISNPAAEKQPPDTREQWITEIFVERRHCTRLDTSPETVSHDEIVSLP